MDRIVLHVRYSGEGAADFAREMKESGLQQQVQNEDGCLQYDYFLALDGTDDVVLLEGWRDAAALASHAAGEPMRQLKELKSRYGLETGIERFE